MARPKLAHSGQAWAGFLAQQLGRSGLGPQFFISGFFLARSEKMPRYSLYLPVASRSRSCKFEHDALQIKFNPM
jgi:hypothetical protein